MMNKEARTRANAERRSLSSGNRTSRGRGLLGAVFVTLSFPSHFRDIRAMPIRLEMGQNNEPGRFSEAHAARGTGLNDP